MKLKSEGRMCPEQCASSPDFWRGIVDGDGCIGMYANRWTLTNPFISVCGHKSVMDGFLAFSKSHLPSTRVSVLKHPRANIHTVQFDCLNARKIISVLYSGDGPRLARKNELAQSIANLPLLKQQKLADAKVLEIRRRRLAGETAVALAKEFGKCKSTIYAVCNGQSWASLQ